MQRLLWNERWACETAAFIYSFLLFPSEILKILFVVVKETSLSYVEVLFAIMYLDWHSLAHSLSKSATYSNILIHSYWYDWSIAFTDLYFKHERIFLPSKKVCRY